MLSRLALRLAAIEALCPAALVTTGPWPTIAGPRVYDSRLDQIESDDDIAAIEGKPLLIIYTEEDEGRPYGTAKQWPDSQVVHLVVESMIAAKGSIEVPLADGTIATVGTIEAPITDRQHEAHLDLLDGLVRRVFDVRNLVPSAALLPLVLMELQEVDSFPQRDASRETRLAARTTKYKCRIKQDKWPALPASPTPTGLDLLPSPLREVAQALPPGSSGALLCASLIAMVPQPAASTPLSGIRIFSGFDGRVPTQPDGSDADVQSSVP